MTNLPKDICLKFKEARQSKHLNQSALAQMVGCRQSAISMFESGMVTKLSDELVEKMALILGVSLEAKNDSAEATSIDVLQPMKPLVRGYCPNADCPSNVPYVVGGRVYYRPSRKIASPDGGSCCAACGEMLEMKCPSCGMPVNDGACCGVCGNAYVTAVLPDDVDVSAYATLRRQEIAQLRSLE